MKILQKKLPANLAKASLRALVVMSWVVSTMKTGLPKKCPDVWSVHGRKGQNSATAVKRIGHGKELLIVWVNPKLTHYDNACGLVIAFQNGAKLSDEQDAELRKWIGIDSFFSMLVRAKAPAKRQGLRPLLVRLRIARERQAEWHVKYIDAHRAFQLAKTKRRRYRAQVRALEREAKKIDSAQAKKMNKKSFSTLMAERRNAREA